MTWSVSERIFRILGDMEKHPERFEHFIVNMAGEAWRVHLALG